MMLIWKKGKKIIFVYISMKRGCSKERAKLIKGDRFMKEDEKVLEAMRAFDDKQRGYYHEALLGAYCYFIGQLDMLMELSTDHLSDNKKMTSEFIRVGAEFRGLRDIDKEFGIGRRDQ